MQIFQSVFSASVEVTLIENIENYLDGVERVVVPLVASEDSQGALHKNEEIINISS